MPAKKPKTEAQPSGLAGSGFPMMAGSAAAQVWMDMGTEAVRFVWERLQQDIKTQQALLACTSLEEMQKVQAAFFTAAQEQYAAEAAKMLDLMGKAAASGMAGSPTARRYDDVPL